MPVKRKTAKRKGTASHRKATYICVPCGTEITITRKGMGASTLMCCGSVMKRKTTKKS